MAMLNRSRCGAVLTRAFWPALGAVHVVPWVGTARALVDAPGPGTLAPWLALTLTILFVALKTLDVPWLRLGSRPRAALAFLLAGALVHHDAVAPGIEDVGSVAVLATVTLSVAIKALPALRTSLARASRMAWPCTGPALGVACVERPIDPIAIGRAPRAPPLAA